MGWTIDNKNIMMYLNPHYLYFRLFNSGNYDLEKRQCWFSKKAINYLASKINSNSEILEIGCGGSTLFFSDRVKSVDSVEDCDEWKEKIKKMLINDNVTFYDYNNYPKNKKYDLILVDGNDRIKFLNEVKSYLKPNGIIVFDNLEQFHIRFEKEFSGWVQGAGKITTGFFELKDDCDSGFKWV